MKIREAILTFRDTGHEMESGKLDTAKRVAQYMRGAIDFRPDQEQAWVILLDVRLRPLGRHLCTLGTVSTTIIHPREVFRSAIAAAASSVILVHNHPSGVAEPSREDDEMTLRLSRCGDTLDIPVLDHVILGAGEGEETSVYSYAKSCNVLLNGP